MAEWAEPLTGTLRQTVIWLAALLLAHPSVADPAQSGAKEQMPLTAALQMQAQCARQAGSLVREMGGTGERRVGPTVTFTDFQSHYNTSLKKCFVLIQTTWTAGEGSGNRLVDLLEAYERRDYAQYTSWPTRADPVNCELMPSLNEKTFCHSEDEFMAFVAQYME